MRGGKTERASLVKPTAPRSDFQPVRVRGAIQDWCKLHIKSDCLKTNVRTDNINAGSSILQFW